MTNSDGHIVVSYSEVNAWLNCRRSYYYAFTLDRRPIKPSLAIDQGVYGHEFMQKFYEFLQMGQTQEQAYAHIKKYAEEKIGTDGRVNQNALYAWILCENYITKAVFKFTEILVENRFLLPATHMVGFENDPELQDVLIGFTPDLLKTRVGNFTDIEDYKFVQKAWADSRLEKHPQVKLYQIFLKRMGYKISRSILRTFNMSTGKIDEHPFVLTDAEEVFLTRAFMEIVKEIVAFKRLSPEKQSHAPITFNSMTCHYCSYKTPCGLDRKGASSVETLKNMFVGSSYDYTK